MLEIKTKKRKNMDNEYAIELKYDGSDSNIDIINMLCMIMDHVITKMVNAPTNKDAGITRKDYLVLIKKVIENQIDKE